MRENLALPTSALAGRGSVPAVAGRKLWTMEEVLKEFPQLQERLASAGGSLSGGEQQMLAIGRALMANPTLILMDEPSEGLSPKLVQRVEEIMRRLRESGLSILLVEQNLELALSVADSIYVISSGQLRVPRNARQSSRRARIFWTAISASRRTLRRWSFQAVIAAGHISFPGFLNARKIAKHYATALGHQWSSL